MLSLAQQQVLIDKETFCDKLLFDQKAEVGEKTLGTPLPDGK